MDCVFTSISKIQKSLQQTFKDANIDLDLVTVCDDKNLPSFRGSSIIDTSGSSLDIEFRNQQGHFLIVHLFNQNAFALTFNNNYLTSIFSIEQLRDDKFLKELKCVFDQRNFNTRQDVCEAAFKFNNNFRR